jgi:hypothetical protein
MKQQYMRRRMRSEEGKKGKLAMVYVYGKE